MSALDELLHDQQAIMLVYSGEILDAALFKAAIRAEIAEQVRSAMEPKPVSWCEHVDCKIIGPHIHKIEGPFESFGPKA